MILRNDLSSENKMSRYVLYFSVYKKMLRNSNGMTSRNYRLRHFVLFSFVTQFLMMISFTKINIGDRIGIFLRKIIWKQFRCQFCKITVEYLSSRKVVKYHNDLSWNRSRLFTFAFVLRDSSLIIEQSEWYGFQVFRRNSRNNELVHCSKRSQT